MEDRFRLPTEIPLEEYPKPQEFVEEAIRIIDKSNEINIPLRVMGGLAIYLRIKDMDQYLVDLWRRLGRLGERVFTDIDLAGYSKHREAIRKLLEELGYKIWQPSLWRFAGTRYIFYGGRIPMVEVFFDRLKMNHVIEFKGRLELSDYTLPPADLLLVKLQIVKINEKDLKDAIVLLRAFDLGEDDKNTINYKYIAKVMAKDWGFYYTFTTNLKKVNEYAKNLNQLTDQDKQVISSRIERLLEAIEAEPKSMSWKLRAKIGTKRKWYEEVEDWV